ncbi:hypothetical protein SLEP1_g52664 [Rubroshorea leprosula]|uniref:Uncharacterized protein n=1 Tax=Rubroshorea leprosula TaxID=152421 RepID=A0AAV5M8R0_9ROSI|nr:hypothetical protein SLEP1_g52664 [Rubroshorea leprosula]
MRSGSIRKTVKEDDDLLFERDLLEDLKEQLTIWVLLK